MSELFAGIGRNGFDVPDDFEQFDVFDRFEIPGFIVNVTSDRAEQPR